MLVTLRVMFRRYRGPLALFLCAALGGLAPLIITLSAGAVAEMNGCILHEGYPNPCVILGADRGDILYTLGVFGWFSLVTIPFGAFGCVGALLWGIAVAIGDWRRRRGTGAPQS